MKKEDFESLRRALAEVREARIARPSGDPIDIDAAFDRVMKRFPNIITRLGK